MTTVDHHAPVIPLRRPAVHASTLVRSDREHTFDTFVRTIGVWWPVQPLSAGRERVRDVTFERQVGGRVYEIWDDGTTVDWGEVGVWDPPAGFTMSWHGTPVPTEVELSFTALGPNLTRATVEHRGWEALTEEQLAEDCAYRGGYSTGGYDLGWTKVLELFRAAVERAEPEISDQYMLEMLGRSRQYSAVLLRQGPRYFAEGSDTIIWEHGRRNFALRAAGLLAIVCPVRDGSPWCGIGIFNASAGETARILDGDPGVRAGVFEYEIHPVSSFPGDKLPEQ
jgi:hypothetical protein